MTRLALIALLAGTTALPVSAQQQQAGNAASMDTEGTFQALVEACDDIDAMMLRARIRLQLPRTTEEAAAKAQEMLDQGFATCGSGDLEGAKATLTEALAIAEAGATEVFGTDAATEEEETAAAESTETVAEPTAAATEEAEEKKPWWKIW